MSFIVPKYRYIVKNSFELPLGLFMFSSLAHIKYTNTLEIHFIFIIIIITTYIVWHCLARFTLLCVFALSIFTYWWLRLSVSQAWNMSGHFSCTNQRSSCYMLWVCHGELGKIVFKQFCNLCVCEKITRHKKRMFAGEFMILLQKEFYYFQFE